MNSNVNILLTFLFVVGTLTVILLRRKKRSQTFKLRGLSAEQHRLFAERWRSLQSLFVDQPSRAVIEADHLVRDAMNACGLSVGNFEQRAADIPVDHQRVVEKYRAADTIVQRNSRGEATIEELRKVMVYFRELFEDLLGDQERTQPR